MADDRREGPGPDTESVPRDLPDQQADEGQDDPWEVPVEAAADTADERDDVPDTDEAGTGRQGAPHSAGVHPEQPVPDEPAD
jgi:hypothetical protein